MRQKVLSGSLFVIGTAVGAGMLGIPLVTAKMGFFPAALVSALVAIFMCLTGLLLLEVVLFMQEEVNLLTISRKILGDLGAKFVAATFLFLYYCLLSAYFSVGSPMLGSALDGLFGYLPSPFFSLLLFGFLFGGVVLLGMKWVDRCNYLAIFLMAVSYAFLLFFGFSKLSWERLFDSSFIASVGAFPILFSSFGYHNIIPSLSSYFDYDRAILRRSIIYGCFAVFLIYLFWQALLLGSIPKEAFSTAAEKNPYAILQYLEEGGSLIFYFSTTFGFFAVITSFFGVSFSMVDFIKDALRSSSLKESRLFLCFLTFFPPLFFTGIRPALFVDALELAGGVGEAILNGILPILLVWKVREALRKKKQAKALLQTRLLALLLLFACFVFLIEIYMLMSG